MKALKNLHKLDQPREKLAHRGTQALKNEELLAVLLGSGVKGKDVLKLSREIIALLENDFDGLTLDKLCQVHGLGMAKASQVLASIELSRRYLIRSNKKIRSASDIYDELSGYANKKQEHFLTITVDGASHLINTRVVFIGTLNQSIVHPREVFADAIEDRAAGIIIAHNHPSGTLKASHADIRITDRLKDVSRLVGIELIDHVIISKNGYYSFCDEGIL